MNKELKSVIDVFLSEIKEAKKMPDTYKDPVRKKPIAYHLTPDYKKKYEYLQAVTNRGFGRMIEKLIVQAIDVASE